jgi:hypothetical protein
MPNGSSRVRRQLRAHFWGSTKLSRNLRGIRPVAVGVTVNGFFGTINLDGMNALQGAEKSCRVRRSRRGQRKGRRRSRGLSPSSPSIPERPNSTAGTLTDRKVRRASAQIVYWKGKLKKVEQSLQRLGKERFFVRSRTERFNARTGEVTRPLVAHDRYVLLREVFRTIQRRLKVACLWARPLREKWIGFLDTRFRFQPPGVAPAWSQLVGPPGMLEEFLEVCSEVGIRPNFSSWGRFSQNNFARTPRVRANPERINQRHSSESTHRSSGANRPRNMATVKFCHRCARLTARSPRGFCLTCSRSV